MARQRTETPRVFISSTSENLAEFRTAARDAVEQADCHTLPFESWEAADRSPLAECLSRVDQADVVIAIVAQRHGWMPPDQPPGQFKSITRLECERAAQKSIPILPFLLDEKAEWPAERFEKYRLIEGMGKGLNLNDLAAEIARNETSLADSKRWLCQGRQRKTFTTPEQLHGEVLRALYEWRLKDADPRFRPPPATAGFDRESYKEWVRRTCESVELLGLDLKQAQNARLQQVYVPAIVPSSREEGRRSTGSRGRAAEPALEESPAVLLLHRLGQESLYVPGDPGAGKSTFCRWAALVTALGRVSEHSVPCPDEFREELPEDLRGRLPVLCPLRDLAAQRELVRGSGHWTRSQLEDALAGWLDRTRPGGLTGGVWRALMNEERCLLILDGVDELPVSIGEGADTDYPRGNVLTGLADALPAWVRQCGHRVLLTSRSYGIDAAALQRLALPEAQLQLLAPALQDTFIRRWFAAADPPRARDKAEGLIAHLAERHDLEEMQANPMLLTALCVKYDEGARLPEDVHTLYHDVINQVLHNRYPDRAAREGSRRRLAVIAHGMHAGEPGGAQRATPEAVVSYDEIDRFLAAYARPEPSTERGADESARKRDDLLARSGLLLSRGHDKAGFYHLSFQDFLAAERLDILNEDLAECFRRWSDRPEWRRALTFRFCSIAGRSPQAALDATRDALLGSLRAEALTKNANPALLLADCLEIAHARGASLQEFANPLVQACERADPAPVAARARLWEARGRLGEDRRPGVGLDADGLPDLYRAWCDVPGGSVKLEDNAGTFGVKPFQIARFPVTNAQFQGFIDAEDGYSNLRWWDETWLKWVDPGAPPKPGWTAPNGPRETVSWHEAMAFCRWLDQRLRERGRVPGDRQVRLPLEWEWQQAATGGEPGREYPWGGPWDPAKANTGEEEPERTTAVGMYPAGAAPCGALDVAGNVWEWCWNAYHKPEKLTPKGDVVRALRGGSWRYLRVYARCALRMWFDPGGRYDFFGFRVCLSSPIS